MIELMVVRISIQFLIIMLLIMVFNSITNNQDEIIKSKDEAIEALMEYINSNGLDFNETHPYNEFLGYLDEEAEHGS